MEADVAQGMLYPYDWESASDCCRIRLCQLFDKDQRKAFETNNSLGRFASIIPACIPYRLHFCKLCMHVWSQPGQYLVGDEFPIVLFGIDFQKLQAPVTVQIKCRMLACIELQLLL